MCEKQNDIKHKKARFSESEDGGNDNNGLVISKPVAVALSFLLVLIVVAAVLITYFLPTCPLNVTPKSSSCEKGSGSSSDDGFPIPKAPEPEEELPPFEGRLPLTLDPIIYEVKLKPYLDDQDGDKQFSYEGELNFTFECVEATNLIILHIGKLLYIDSSKVRLRTGQFNELTIRDTSYHEEYDFVIFETESFLQIDATYTLTLEYNGTLHDDRWGFYVETYTTNNETRYTAATQLETVYARRVFPCLDEPSMKANFSIAITHRSRRQAFSNMEDIRIEYLEDDWMTTYFDTTVVMSTYLVAIVVADFACLEKVTDKGVEFRVCCTPEKVENLDFSIEIGSRLLTYFENLFEMPYGLSKMDMVGVPWGVSAMENWGLIIYSEDHLLYNESAHSPGTKLEVAKIIVHEIAHQWFGNIVTCSWWSDLWLNEGLARYFEGIGMEFLDKEWQYMDQLYVLDVYEAMYKDSKSRTSHPVIMPEVGWPAENEGMFDSAITYSKGGCLARMMESFLGTDVFFQGLRSYLRKHKYASTKTIDFFNAMTEVSATYSDKSVTELMDPWLRQAGYPIVTLTRRGNKVHADQYIFLQYKKDKPDDKHPHMGYKWHVPVLYTYEGEHDFDTGHLEWMHMGPAEFQLPSDVKQEHWLLANINQRGFYRVNYDMENWEKLAEQLKTNHTVIPVRNRGALLSDAMFLNKAQQLNGVVVLKLMEYLKNETEFYPWYCVSTTATYLWDMLAHTSTYWYLQKFMQDIIRPIYNRLGWDFRSGDHIDYYTREHAVFEIACHFGLPECVQKATSLFRQWMKDPDNNRIDDKLKYTLFCAAVKYGDSEMWDYAFEISKIYESEKWIIWSALGCSRDQFTLQRYLEHGMETGDIQVTTVTTFIRRASSAAGLSLAWNFLFDNFDVLYERYNTTAYRYIWYRFDEKLNTPQHLAKLESFARAHTDMPGEIAYEYYKAAEIVKNNIEWMEGNHQEIHDWLKEVTGQKLDGNPSSYI
ncbi:aminopeptidase N-like [Glandiceps talaboti]